MTFRPRHRKPDLGEVLGHAEEFESVRSVFKAEIINVGDFALIWHQLTTEVAFDYSAKPQKFAKKRAPDSLVTWVLRFLSYLAPVMDKSVRLDLQDFRTNVIDEPETQ